MWPILKTKYNILELKKVHRQSGGYKYEKCVL